MFIHECLEIVIHLQDPGKQQNTPHFLSELFGPELSRAAVSFCPLSVASFSFFFSS